ncbi:MAG TPA: PASTA domain-containing protein [Solirubrobacteraceae bacterium]|jgi:hypothetical protein|nr:PASTA domain-containing protein [Solirubrobacteraceae bacterium]
MRRVLVASVALPLAALLGGCGSNSRAPAETPVHLSVSGPADGSRLTARSALITGTVSPAGATVLVAGRGVPVSGGSFQARVALSPGQNIVDVLAGAPRARAAMQAVRVFRQVDVPVPSVSGQTPAAATATLRARGLTAQIIDNEPFYAFLLPGSPTVCRTSPAAGQPLAPGSTVTVTVSKSC